ncbi:N-terminal acetyltransferase B complex auxiliary subunit NAA25 [Nymphaea colorata]|nr:N-terminal acetyltransferase B complex auxiliary subunit NAA25 [Nymphaea colorata]
MMASKVGYAGGIPERRVRPIWDAVDSRQYKNALKLATALLTKYPNSPYALALKALIVERMGKTDEALSLCRNAKDLLYKDESAHIDDLTLSTLQIVLQRLDQLDLATSCYEYACQKYANNLELLMGLFKCHVREHSYVKQQQTAMKMYKLVGEERFLLWVVCSIQLQVFCGDGGEKLLQLAEALLKKHITSHGLHESEALLVYISILEEQGKYTTALEVLSGKLGSLLVIEVDRLKLQGRLLARASDYVVAAETFQKVLESCPDDWEPFLHYLDCLSEGNMSGVFCKQEYTKSEGCNLTNLTGELIDSRLSNALSFVQRLQSVNGSDIRCPHLASLEIHRRRRLYQNINDETLMNNVLEYFHGFGHLSCFASDVESILHSFSLEEKIKLLEKLLEHQEVSSFFSMKAFGQFITVFKIRELLGTAFSLSESELLHSTIKMAQMYCKSLSLSKDLDPQESMHGEELLSMACNLLIQLYWRTKHLGFFYEAIMVLEFGLAVQSNVWQYKILLLHLYSQCTAIPAAYECYRKLEIKNILLETMSHHIRPQLLTSPFWSLLDNLLKEYLKFFEEYTKEAADLTFLAYQHRNYSKVLEFVKFGKRLVHSHWYLTAKLEASILQLKQLAQNLEEVEAFLESINFGCNFIEISNKEKLKSLTFNDDLHARPWWSPTSHENCLLGPFDESFHNVRENLLKGKEARLLQAIEKRSLIPRLVCLSIQNTAASFQETLESNGTSHDNKSNLELRSLLDQYAIILGLPFDDAVNMLTKLSDGQKALQDVNSEMIDWMNFAIFHNAWMISSHLGGSGGSKQGNSCWTTVESLIDKCVTQCLLSSELHSMCRWNTFPLLVQIVTESFAWHQLIIQSCIRMLHPMGRKKKKGGGLDRNQSPVLHAVRGSVDCLYRVIQDIRVWLAEKINMPEDEKLESLLTLVRRGEDHDSILPGSVLQIVEAAACLGERELRGESICESLQNWSSAEVARKIINSQNLQLLEFDRICNVKLTFLGALKHSF